LHDSFRRQLVALPVLTFSEPRAQAEETIDYIPLAVANPGFEQSSTSLHISPTG
jgi:hypothetical protein